MKKIVIFIAAISLVVMAPLSVQAAPLSFGALVGSSCDAAGMTDKDSSLCDDANKNQEVNKYLKNIINFLLLVVGVLAVIMIIVSAIKFAISAGDSAKLTSAKNTLLYSIIGLSVALASFWIVNTVLAEVTAPPPSSKPGSTGGNTVNTPI